MKRIMIYLLVAAFTGMVAAAFITWIVALRPNLDIDGNVRIFVPAGSSVDDFIDTLRSAGGLKSERTFLITSRLKLLNRSLKPGSYLLEPGLSNNRMVNILRSGQQTPMRVTFNNIRTLDDLAGRIGGQIEADSASLAQFFHEENNYSADGFTPETLISLFIPDTYEFYWNTDAEGFYRRMLREFRSYWNKDRMAAAEDLGLSPVDVSTLASIIDDEVAKNDEKPRIAGVYLNRLRLGIPLQACPTIKFALNDFTIRRVLYEHLETDSPYNTYKYRGLPPGPVRCPTKSGIEAVLKAEKHDYLYFAARADFSGYHHFSRTLAEHNRYANAYQRELDKRKIYE
ncbi:MAG: endolytic transglycosylase MltG [Bacteroidales bacterium]|nr:endolytic transglycosylase MltG [Bacteroidales bacterium]